ncbi:MAG: nucleotide-binding protein [Rhodococcus qingshengii]
MSLPKLFIGSSAEGSAVAHYLQDVLEGRKVCEVTVWDQGVFEPGSYALEKLLEVAGKNDFAVLIASPDDTTVSRGDTTPSARDNVILELGLFIGALGRDRAYLLATGDVKLPTDTFGLTRLKYQERADGNLQAAVSPAALQIKEQVAKHGSRTATASAAVRGGSLDRELELLCANAESQGWKVKSNSPTTLRLVSPDGARSHSMRKRTPAITRDELRAFAAKLRADGLRVNSAILSPPEESPL